MRDPAAGGPRGPAETTVLGIDPGTAVTGYGVVRRAADGAYVGTLSDASGPVRATVSGNTMSLSYPMKRRGFRMNQLLTLQPGGRTLLNRASVRLLGVTVARITERIDKVD